MVVGQTLQILGPDENSFDKYQWYQIDLNGDWLLISGATRNQVGIFTCRLSHLGISHAYLNSRLEPFNLFIQFASCEFKILAPFFYVQG